MIPNLAQSLASSPTGAALPQASATPAGAVAVPSLPPADGRARAAKAAAPRSAASASPSGASASGTSPSAAPRARASASGYAATAAPSASRAPAAKAGPLAFLEDRNLSVEEKLMRLLAYLSDKWDKDLEKKMKEIEAGQQKAASGATGTAQAKKKGGLLGSVGAIVKTASGFFPAVGLAMDALRIPEVRAALSKVGGPVLAAAATALGYPALSPLLLRYGPAIVDVAAGVATSLDDGAAGSGGGANASGSSAAGAGSSPSATGMNDSELRLKLMEIERIQNLQKEMFSLVSNILRAGHETRMNVIQNVR
jgi:hypothetical protein